MGRLLRSHRAPAVRPRDPLHAAGIGEFLSAASDPASGDGARDPRRKIVSREEARRWRRGAEGTVVFTNGVFDLLHPGHVDLLTAARREGERLVVGMNSDASTRRLKGPGRPARSEPERALVLAALECVDLVVSFDEDTPLELVRALEPDVIVKGGDYAPDDVVGADIVRARGGRVVIVPLTSGHSTTSTLAKLTGRVDG